MIGSNWEVFIGSGTPPPPLGKTVAYYLCKAILLKIGPHPPSLFTTCYITGVNKPWIKIIDGEISPSSNTSGGNAHMHKIT